MLFARRIILRTQCKIQTIISRQASSINNNVIQSIVSDIDIPKIPFHEQIWQNLDKYSEKIALTSFETKRSYTYTQLYKATQNLANFLRNKAGLTDRQTVAVILPNLPEYPIIYLAASQANLIVTTCNPNYNSAEIQRQIQSSDARLVFTCTNLVENVQNALKNFKNDIKIIEIKRGNAASSAGVINFEEIVSGNSEYKDWGAKWTDTAVLPYSSGTTGLPKGVELTHYNLTSNLLQMSHPKMRLFGEMEAVVPAFLPFFHIYGKVVVLLQTLMTGNHIISVSQFTSESFMGVLQNYKPTHLYGIPLIVNLIINNPNIKVEHLASLKMFLSGAAPLGSGDVERFQAKTNDKIMLMQGYGMTESSPLTLQQNPNISKGIKVGSSGMVVANTLAKIISSEGNSLEALGPNQSGELLIKGPQVMKGYYKNPQATDETIIDGGWLKTGDIAFYDEDNHFYITDRLKELIKVKGFQVAPAELEAILRSFPDIADAGVIGVPHEKLGEAPKAFVVPKPGKTLKEKDVKDFVAQKVSDFKELAGGVVFVDSIPKNPSGKILRKELRKM